MDPTDAHLLPVVVIDHADRAEPLGLALLAGGLPVAEVTLRTAASVTAIRRMSAIPDLLVGAGTVLTAEQVDQAFEAGARFIVSPGLSEGVVMRAQQYQLPVYPGVVTPTEIMHALDLGVTTVKFFPASLYGGSPGLKALGAPFPQVRFIPTGGVSAASMAEYLSLPNVAAVGGSWMVPRAAIEAGEYAAIRRLCTESVAAAASAGRMR